ncbi:MAG: EAL domain-containing protein [Bulleidia sp.]
MKSASRKKGSALAALSEEEMQRIVPEIIQENRESLILVSSGSSIVYAVLLIFALTTPAFYGSGVLSGIMLILMIALFLYLRIRRPEQKKTILFLCYFLIAVLCGSAIIRGTYLSRSGTAGSFFGVLLGIPLFFITRPRKFRWLIGTAVAVFLIMAVRFDLPEYAVIDGFSAIVFGILSIILNARVSRMKIQSLLYQKELSDVSQRDVLTGLKNRNCYDQSYYRYPEQCRNLLACIYLDANGLHELNDTKGHEAGDEMLIMIAGAMREAFGDQDTYRIGGDEIIAFASDISEEELKNSISNLREKISQKSYSASIGCEVQKKEELDINSLIRDAEQRMYDDKRRYYELAGNDRRRSDSDELEEIIRVVNHSELPEAIYSFRDGRVRTICVSDGLYDMMHCEDEPDKASLIARYETNMYRSTMPEDASRIAAEALRFAKEGGRYDVFYHEKIYRQKEFTLTHAVGYHHYLKDGSRIAIVTYSDISRAVREHVESEKAADNSLRKFLDQSDLGMAVIQRSDGELLYCNQTMVRFLKPVKNFDSGMTLSEFVTGTRDQSMLHRVTEIADSGSQMIRFRPEDKPLAIRVSSKEWEGREVFFIRSEPWEELYHDSLTGLPNLTYFRVHAKELMNQIRAEGGTPAFVYFDLYGMKGYNARFGIPEGDRILKYTGEILKNIFEDSALCRLSEDHFLVLSENRGLEPRLQKACEEVRRGSKGTFLQLKAGICAEEDRTIGSRNSDDYLSRAFDDARLACASIRKDAGKSWAYFSGSVSAEYSRQLYVLGEFRKALEKHWIKVFYQPVYDLSSGKLAGYECLARWLDPEKGYISPAEFVPVLEEHHLAAQLDRYMLTEICREAEQRRQVGIGSIPISFNVSRADFTGEDVSKTITEIADTYQIPHDLLNVEITESAFSSDPDFLSAQVEKLHQAGFQVWMDDFGSGYSSLGNLQAMKADLVKLDIRFLRTYEQEKKNGNAEHAADMIRAVISLADALGLHTLCEGAETEEQIGLLRAAGCEYAQGFYLGKPAPLRCFRRTEDCLKQFDASFRPVYNEIRERISEDNSERKGLLL